MDAGPERAFGKIPERAERRRDKGDPGAHNGAEVEMAGTAESVRSELQDVEVAGKRVAVQLPEGLKQCANTVADVLKRKGAKEVFIFIDPAYGACDVKDFEAKELGADVLIHVGHNRFGNTATEIPVVYVPLTLSLDVEKIIKVLRSIPGKIALCTTVHYLPYLDRIKKKLGNKIVVGKSTFGDEGQVLGCDPSACSVDADVNVVITDGVFHGIIARMWTGRKTYVLTPAGKLIDMEPHAEKYVRQREAAKAFAKTARRVGVVITMKKGQRNIKAAKQLAKILESNGLCADVLVCDYFFPEYVKGMPYDAYVFTGCPRVAIDDYARFEKPVLTVAEALEVWNGCKVER